MSVVHNARRLITRAADATTATAGALGGAAVTGVIGAVEGTAAGVKNGLSSGSHSTTAAALTLGAIGVAGLVDWPILVAVGGGALLIHELSRRSQTKTHDAATASQTATSASRTAKSSPRKTSAHT